MILSADSTLNTTKLKQACTLVLGVRKGLQRFKIHNSVFIVSILNSGTLLYLLSHNTQHSTWHCSENAGRMNFSQNFQSKLLPKYYSNTKALLVLQFKKKRGIDHGNIKNLAQTYLSLNGRGKGIKYKLSVISEGCNTQHRSQQWVF